MVFMVIVVIILLVLLVGKWGDINIIDDYVVFVCFIRWF